MKFTLNRNHVHVTKDGPSYGFKKGIPLFVPNKYASEVIAIGAEAVEEDEVEAAELRAQVAREQASDRARVDAIKGAVRKLVGRNASGDFTAGGIPKKRPLEAIAGIGDIAQAEIHTAFAEVKQELQAAG
jgi:hypothetical protein